MDIIVPLPPEGTFTDPASWQDATGIIEARSPDVRALARRAFHDRDRASWESVQKLLYLWNMEEFRRTTPVTDHGRAVRQALRNCIIEEQERVDGDDPGLRLACYDSFSQDRALDELYHRAIEHRINTHPLLREMQEHHLSPEGVQLFLENYYVNNCIFHLHIASQSMSVPFEIRPELAQNFYDELGEGRRDRAHPVLFLKNFDAFGRPDSVTPLAESLHLMNTKIYCSMLAGSYHVGLGCFGFIEVTMPTQMRAILAGLGRSGLSRDNLEFWRLHISIDEVHGKTWFEEMRQLITTPEQAQDVLRGGIRGLDGRAGVYDAVWNAVTAAA